MSKPKQTWKAPDGVVFESRTEYRDYLMSNFYSFKNKHNEVLMKLPGDIDGQVFDIADCTNTSMSIMDYTDQVQIDNLKNCKVFIGACGSSLFIRNCENCVFYTCSKQLRLREVTNSTFFTFCTSELHIEESNNLKFGPFLGGYLEQKEHFQKAGLDSTKNLWYDVYDHTKDPTGEDLHYSLLSVSEALSKAWYPKGDESKMEQFITLTTPTSKPPSTSSTSTTADDVKEATQVGQSFSLEQMKADAAAAAAVSIKSAKASSTTTSSYTNNNKPSTVEHASSKPKSKAAAAAAAALTTAASAVAPKVFEPKPAPMEPLKPKIQVAVKESTKPQLTLETALLIATASAKGTDLGIWFEKSTYNNKLEFSMFDSKLQSLAATMSINADKETKHELDIAVNRNSLRLIHQLCARSYTTNSNNNNSDSQQQQQQQSSPQNREYIDVSLFLKLCTRLSDAYIEKIERESEEEERAEQRQQQQAANVKKRAQETQASTSTITSTTQTTRQSVTTTHTNTGERFHTMYDEDNNATYDVAEEELESKFGPNRGDKSQRAASSAVGPAGHGHGLEAYGSDDLGSYNPALVMTASEYLSNSRPSGGAVTANSPKAAAAVATKMSKYIHITANNTTSASHDLPYESPLKQLSLKHAQEYLLSESIKIPSSPYDEAVHFGDFDSEGEGEGDDEVDSNYLNRGHQNKVMKDTNSRLWEHENQRYLNNSAFGADSSIEFSSNIPHNDRVKTTTGGGGDYDAVSKPRPSSAGPRMRQHNASAGGGGGGVGSHHMVPTDAGDSIDYLRATRGFGGRGVSAPGGGVNGQQRGRSSSTGRGGAGNRTSLSTMSRGTHTKTSGTGTVFATDRILYMKDLVEDLVRNTVKKVDLYHLVQINLGFVNNCTMIPPRGQIVTAKPRAWLTTRDLQTAFMAGRLCLNEAQIIILRSLVVTFAKEYSTIYAEECDPGDVNNNNNNADSTLSNDHAGVSNNNKKAKKGKSTLHVLGPQHTLSAEWLKKYLVHLRLTKKTVGNDQTQSQQQQQQQQQRVSVSGSNNLATASGTAGVAGVITSTDDIPRNPILFKEWLGNKLKTEIERAPIKPREFLKALDGQPHTLAREDAEKFLRKYKILPVETLNEEIELRIKAWMADVSGRRDFQHDYNVKLRNHIYKVWKTKAEKEAAANGTSCIVSKVPKNETGYWSIFNKMSEEQKKEIKNNLTTILMNEKRQELLTKERTNYEITRELFFKFQVSFKDRPQPWNDWLRDHLSSFASTIKKFKTDESQRENYSVKLSSARKSVAGLNDVEVKLNKVVRESNLLDTHHTMALQKGIVALRRTAESKQLAKGTVISRDDFDKHIKRILVPHIKIEDPVNPPTAVPVAATVNNPQQENIARNINELFHSDLNTAVDRVLDVEKTKSEENKRRYDEWLAKKAEERREAAKKKAEEAEKAEKEKEVQKRKGKKAYDKWLRMSRKNKYKSMVDKKYHEIPTSRRLEHSRSFHVEKEMAGYYAEKEKIY